MSIYSDGATMLSRHRIRVHPDSPRAALDLDHEHRAGSRCLNDDAASGISLDAVVGALVQPARLELPHVVIGTRLPGEHHRGDHMFDRPRGGRALEQCADGHVDRVPDQNVKGNQAAEESDFKHVARALSLRGRHFGAFVHLAPFP